MAQQDEDNKVLPLGGTVAQGEKLPYRIELWDDANGETVERLLARAISAALARAIFKAALTEHPERRITVRRGARVISDSRAD